MLNIIDEFTHECLARILTRGRWEGNLAGGPDADGA